MTSSAAGSPSGIPAGVPKAAGSVAAKPGSVALRSGAAVAGRISGLCVRPGPRVEPEERGALVLDAAEGVVGDHGRREKRQVTILSRESWRAAERAVGTELPWTARRANVLVEGVDLAELLAGGVLRLGGCEVEIVGETFPCDQMEEAHPGLKAALLPETRGGVYGRVLTPGTIRVGDPAAVTMPGRKPKLP